MYTQVVQVTQAIELVSDLEPSIFLRSVWVKHDSIGATPSRHPSLKVFGLDRLAGLPLISKSHGRGFISHGLLSVSMTDLHSHTKGGLNPSWKC